MPDRPRILRGFPSASRQTSSPPRAGAPPLSPSSPTTPPPNPPTAATASTTTSNKLAYSQQSNDDDQNDDPVVACLPERSTHPYSSIALSPDRQYAITACKDTLQILKIGPSGIQHLKNIPMAQHFSTPTATTTTPTGGAGANTSTGNNQPHRGGGGIMGRIHEENAAARDSFVLDAFGFGHHRHGGPGGAAAAAAAAATHQSPMINVVITDVAWSSAPPPPPSSSSSVSPGLNTESAGGGTSSTTADHHHHHHHGGENKSKETSINDNSLIAAAGSNGVIVVWNAATLLEGVTTAAAAGAGSSGKNSARSVATHTSLGGPEAVLSQHVRAVNRLAWHPKRHGLLLSASQDATVLLWERRRVSEETSSTTTAAGGGASAHHAYQPPTLRGLLFGGMASHTPVQKRTYSWHCRSKFEPKSEAVRDIRWSPFYEDVFALVTSSGSLIAYNMHVPPRALVKMTAHSGDATTLDWHPTLADVVATGGASDRSVKVWNLSSFLSLNKKDDSYMAFNANTIKDDSYMAFNANTITSQATEGSSDTDRSTPPLGFQFRGLTSSPATNTLNSTSRHKSSSPKSLLHVLATLASVTRLRWRPPANESFPLECDDRHGAMLAVATAPVKGASAGGAGLLALWSYQRPFMPLSVVQGHREGAVTDFDWLDTPSQDTSITGSPPRPVFTDSKRGARRGQHFDPTSNETHRSGSSRVPGVSSEHDSDLGLHDHSEVDDIDKPIGIWQHALSVGRDGRCLIQSFVRGDRPISRVPPSCFSMANLSPFQNGCGSLQVFSVCQPVPSDPESDFYLTGLRRDSTTAAAPGIFREVPLEDNIPSSLLNRPLVHTRFPISSPKLVFNVIDQGNLNRESKPIEHSNPAITVAPEVVHLSRFASQYILYPDEQYPTRASLCLHNAVVAENLMCGNLAHMWRMIASMLESTGMDELPSTKESGPSNVMSFIILPTLKSLLEERADDGDVQTCVALCEVLQVIKADQTVGIPGLSISLVREWYLSYIDILRDFCLFSHASFLIRSSKDPFVSALNQQSTTIHESCPRCGKPIATTDGTDVEGGTAHRICRSCRRRVGFCFLCHEPVRGMYVWCPGCGHGGHLDHALQWFGGLSGKAVREVCPTGCGHKCNMLQQLISFPRTESIKDFSTD